MRGFPQVGEQLEIDHEALSDLGLMVHHAVAGMDHDAFDENRGGHRRLSIAARTRSACTVSATSWVRMMRAPLWAASTCADIEPASRCCGSGGETDASKNFF